MEIKAKIPEDKRYLEFFELFNAQNFFEAHEVLEDLWREEKGPNRDFYQGLIQIAAAFVHAQKENSEGTRNLLEKAGRHLSKYPDEYGGFHIPSMLREVNQSAQTGHFPSLIPR